ncbi:MAG: carbon-nitrogen hydrolase family protein [Rhodobacteraceae bacterium]|nr:carbon-nitrogen hydrolase family protein [Paracoccaceae bacterium]
MINRTVRVAAAQAAPVFLDRSATTDKACALIREAGSNGADVIVFPEGYIPAHPSWYHHHVATGPFSSALALRLFENAVEIPGPETQALCAAAREAGCVVIMGLCERLAGSNGTLFNTHITIDADGTLLGKHQKFMPTVGERLVHAGGHGDTFGGHDTKLGRVSGLICGENLNPLAIFALTQENSLIHGMSWPAYFGLGGTPMQLLVQANSQAFALMSGAYVISACGVLDPATVEAMQMPEADRATLDEPGRLGGSMIVSPSGAIIAGPMGPEEGVLYAECDLSVIRRAKLSVDFSGHYNRPDIFSLRVNRKAPAARIDHGAPIAEPLAEWPETGRRSEE